MTDGKISINHLSKEITKLSNIINPVKEYYFQKIESSIKKYKNNKTQSDEQKELTALININSEANKIKKEIQFISNELKKIP